MGLSRRDFLSLSVGGFAGAAFGCAGPSRSRQPLSRYHKTLTLGAGKEWRFRPLVLDLNGDGHVDLVASARNVQSSLHIWLGDGSGAFTPMTPTWSDVGYAALATGDINGDGFPDIVAASHFGGVQTLLSDGRGGFTEKTFKGRDGYVAAQLADINGDGLLELILVGFQKVGIEIYVGDGQGNWKLHTTLPKERPGPIMPGRDLVIGDLNHDGHLDLIAAFQRWGIYVYFGDGRGGFSGGPVEVFNQSSPVREFLSLALADVNRDGHLDLVINGTFVPNQPNGPDVALGGRRHRRERADVLRPNQLNGPDVYLGDGKGGWKASSDGLKVVNFPSAGIAVGDLDGDGTPGIVASGVPIGDNPAAGHGLFWFRGNKKGGWHLVKESGLPTTELPKVHSVTLADIDHDGAPEIIALSGTEDGFITIWKRV